MGRLQPYGFTVAEASESQRGSTVRLANGLASVLVTADWLEGEMEVAAGPIGEEGVSFHDLVPPESTHGLRLRRLPRDVSTSVVAEQLAQVADLLLQHQPAILTRT